MPEDARRASRAGRLAMGLSVHHSIRSFSLLSGLALHPLETVFTYAS